MTTLRLLIPSVLVLVGCGQSSGYQASDLRRAGTTGFTADGDGPVGEGPEYTINGDATAESRLSEVIPAPTDVNDLKHRVRQFEFSRFDANQTKPSRFGNDHWELIVYFRKGHPLKMLGKFVDVAGKRTLKASRPDRRFSITESNLIDVRTPFEKTKLLFTLRDAKKKDAIEISYLAYRATVGVASDSEKAEVAGSTLACQIQSLRENTFGWANNWTVLNNGPVFYLYDLVRTVDPAKAARDCLPPKISLSGESLATISKKAGADGAPVVEKVYEHPVKSELGDVLLIGNPDEGNKRMFVVPLGDQSNPSNVVMTFNAENPEPETVDPSETPDLPPDLLTPEEEDAPATSPVLVPQDAADSAAPTVAPSAPVPRSPRPSRATPAPTAAPVSPPPAPAATPPPARPAIRIVGDAFLPNSMDLPRSARMVRDFERNRDVRGVWKFINEYKADVKTRGSRRAGLQRFFTNAAAFRGLMQAVSRTYDVIGWAYLTVVESAYFTGGIFKIEIGDGGLAFGAFQLHPKAAQEGGLVVTNRDDDERNFFAPASCAAAQYVAKRADEYPNDATIAIMAYNRGGGGAGAAIYCSYHAEAAANRKACAARITGGFSKTEYGRFMKLAKNYRYAYREMASFGVLTDAVTNYVNNKLAVFFIASNMSHYGFSVPARTPGLPRSTVFPPNGIQNGRCRQTTTNAPSV